MHKHLALFFHKIWSFLWIGIIFITACTGSEETQVHPLLSNTSWILVGIESIDGQQALIPGSEITAVFTPTHITGTSGCNDYGSPYTINGSTIQIPEVAYTAMDCPSLLLEQESRFIAALSQITTFSVSENELVMETAVSTLTFQKLQPLPLAGTNWQLSGLVQDGVLIETWVDKEITAVFTNNQLSGSAGCNTYTAGYTQTGHTITISAIATTKMRCDTERDQRETQFLNTLTSTAGYATTPNSLTLLDANENPLLTFKKIDPPNPLSGVIWELVALADCRKNNP